MILKKTVALNPGESKVVTFQVTPSEAKTYQVAIDGLSGSFTAIKETPIPAEPFFVKARGPYCTVAMMGPSKAKAGESFNLYVAILNWDLDTNQLIHDFIIYVQPVIDIGGFITEGNYGYATPVQPQFEMTEYGLWPKNSPKFTIMMPPNSLNIRVDAWVEQEYFNVFWHDDASASFVIAQE